MAGGDYGRIRQAFWTDPDIKRALCAEQKALLLYWFTSPHGNLIGLYHCPIEYAAAEVGLPVETVREWTFGVLSSFVSYDESTEEVLVHRGAKHQVAEDLKPKDKRLFAVRKALAEAHSTELVSRFLELYAHWPLDMDHPAPPSAKPNPFEGASKPLDSPSEGVAGRDGSPSKANAVAVAMQSNTNPPGVAHPREAPEPLEVHVGVLDDLDDDQAEEDAVVPGDVGLRTVVERPPIPGMPFAGLDWSGRTNGAAVLREWMALQPSPPSRSDRDRFGTTCRRMADEYTVGEIALAFVGMGYLWPFAPPPVGEDRPWTPEDLRRVFAQALPSARKHPAFEGARQRQEFETALSGGGW